MTNWIGVCEDVLEVKKVIIFIVERIIGFLFFILVDCYLNNLGYLSNVYKVLGFEINWW